MPRRRAAARGRASSARSARSARSSRTRRSPSSSSWLRASRKGWDENNADTTLWPPKWADTHFAGTGRTIDNEVFFNTAQLPLIANPAGVFAMTEEGIAANIEALSKVGITATREMFDTTLLEEI